MAPSRASTKPRVDTPVARRLRELRTRAGLTQAQVAAGRYTSAYISALENGLVRPSMAALTHIAARLDVGIDELVREQGGRWDRLEADLQLAAGNWDVALAHYDTLLDRAASQLDRALIQTGRAEALCRLNRAREAVTDAAAAYETLMRAGASVQAASAGYWLAFANYQLDNLVESRAIAHQLLAEVRAGLAVQDDFKVRLLVALGLIESWDGEHQRALAFLEEARALTDGMDDHRRARFLFTLARTFAESGDHEAALQNGMRALALFEAIQSTAEAGVLRNILALAYLQAGDSERAGQFADDARNTLERLDDRRNLAHVAETQAQIALATNDRAGVHRYALEALDLARSTNDVQAEAGALRSLARERRTADPEAAEGRYRQAADLLRRSGPRRLLQELLREWAELLTEQDRHQEAVELLREALDR